MVRTLSGCSSAEVAPETVAFPLRGEWVAYNTPAERVPTHGTDDFGQRYAYDFLRIDTAQPGWKFYRASRLRYFTRGVPLSDCYAWGQSICAPFDGTVVAARDGWPERNPVHLIRDIILSTGDVSMAFLTKRKRFLALAGNHVIVRRTGGDIHAVMAHLRTGSVRARQGEAIRCGHVVGEVGHSGNSSMPHLHFQLMDGPDPLVAKGVPCQFAGYAAFDGGSWSTGAGIPAKRQLIRNTTDGGR